MRIEERIKKMDNGLDTLGAILLLFINLYIFLDVFMRYFKLPPIGDVVEITGYLNVWITLMGIAFLARGSKHIAVDILTSIVSMATKKVLKSISSIISILFYLIVLYKSTTMVVESYSMNQSLISWQLPVWPFQVIIPIGFLFLFLETIFDLKKSLSHGPEEAR